MQDNWIKLAQDTIEQDEINNLADWIKQNNQLTKGPLTKQFESEFASYLQSPKFLAFLSCQVLGEFLLLNHFYIF